MLSASINEEKLYHICRTKPMFCEQIQYRFSLSLTTSLLLRVTPKAEGTLNAEEDWASATAKAKAEPQKNENFMAPLFIYLFMYCCSFLQRGSDLVVGRCFFSSTSACTLTMHTENTILRLIRLVEISTKKK